MPGRREFLKLLAASLVIDPEELLWTPSRSRIFVPHPQQVEFLTAAQALHLYGIPYHVYDVNRGEWAGISRMNHIIKDDIIKLIQMLEEDKKR